MEQLIQTLYPYFRPFSVILILSLILFTNSWIFKKINTTKLNGNILKHSIATLIVFVGILVFILTFPMAQVLKGQVIGFLAIVLSAGIALSSTTVLGNLIAGIMNSAMKRFRSGDLIKIGEVQGRVTTKSIFHTEVQLEDSNFITIPNLYIATHPVKLTRKSDTVISTSVSLGYDISRLTIEESLKEAALLTGLTNPYVYIVTLGDYSVVYKIHGFLEDSSTYFSTKSQLNAHVMDVLHEKNIQIVSPTFMNQINANDKVFIPKNSSTQYSVHKEKIPEDLIFDEAIKSELIEQKKDTLKALTEQQKTLRKEQKNLKEEDEISKNESSLKNIDQLKTKVEKSIEKHHRENEDHV